MIKLLISGFILLLALNGVSQDRIKEDSSSLFVSRIEDEMRLIDKADKQFQKTTKIVRYCQNYVKKVNVTIVQQGQILRKLSFETFDDSYSTNGREVFYFDSDGKIISHAITIASNVIHEIYNGNVIYVYSKSNGKFTSNTIDDIDMVSYIFSSTNYIVDYYLSNFDNVIYKVFDLKRNNSIVLVTRSQHDLRASPEKQSGIVRKLAAGTELFYLDRSKYRTELAFGKEKWVWIKVRTKDNKVGWIWGHPSVVKQF